MAIIGELAVSITAKTTDFIKGTDKAGKATNKFAKHAKGLKDKMLGLHTVLATFAGVAGLGALSQRFLAVAESMQLVVDRADQLQMSTKALSQLQHAAKRSGVEFDDLVGLLEEMQIRLTEATAGTGSAVDALSRLRLSANELAKSKPEEALETIADALAGIVGMEKIALADAIFGGDGFKALKLIGDGGDAVRKLREEAEALGASFEGDEIQSLTDNMNRMAAAMQAMQNKFVIEMSPAVSEAIEGLMLIYGDSKKKTDTAKIEDLKEKAFLEQVYAPVIPAYRAYSDWFHARTMKKGVGMGTPAATPEDLKSFDPYVKEMRQALHRDQPQPGLDVPDFVGRRSRARETATDRYLKILERNTQAQEEANRSFKEQLRNQPVAPPTEIVIPNS